MEFSPEMGRVRQSPQTPGGLIIPGGHNPLHGRARMLHEKGLLTFQAHRAETLGNEDWLQSIPEDVARQVLLAKVLQDCARELMTAVGAGRPGRRPFEALRQGLTVIQQDDCPTPATAEQTLEQGLRCQGRIE